MTSGTLMPSSAAARARPLAAAELRSGPVPMTLIGSDSSIVVTPSRSTSSSARERSSGVSGLARNGRSSIIGKRTGPVDPEALDDLDLRRDRAGDVGGMAGDLAVAPHRVHVTELDAAARHLHRADQHRAGAHGVDVEIAVGPVALQLLRVEREAVGRADE